jgi:thiol-disulfide isomerase/thioredoxin
MKKNLTFSVILLFSTIFLIQCTRPSPETEGALAVGKSAPNFELQDLTGHRISLSQYKGKVVILDFWATWCGPCRMTMPVMENLQKEFPGTLTLLAINLQEPDSVVRDYVRKQNIGSRVLLDEEGNVGQIYGANAIPMQILIDKQGIIREIKTGYSPNMAASLRRQIQALSTGPG